MVSHKQTLVKGFSDSDASGNKTVREYMHVARNNGFAGRVFGIVDGDGEEPAVLAPQFDPPHAGPLFAWKAYSIECLLAHLPWPTTARWGPAPNWQVDLEVYAPYVAINRLRRILEGRLDILRLARFWHPISGQPLETTADVQAALHADKGLLMGLDVAVEFGNASTRFVTALGNSVEQGLVFLNGKWLLRHFLVNRLKRTPGYWSQEWVQHAEAVGGLAAVRELWERITGSPP
jgi:hypothetical protein